MTSAAPSHRFASTLSTSRWTEVPLSMLWSGSWPSKQLLVSILSSRCKPARFHELEEGKVSTEIALKSMHAHLCDFGSWENQRDEARTHQFEHAFARLDELRSDFIKHQEYIDKSKKFQEGTRTTFEALDQKVGLDTVKSMQAWPSDVVSVGNHRNEALLHKHA